VGAAGVAGAGREGAEAGLLVGSCSLFGGAATDFGVSFISSVPGATASFDFGQPEIRHANKMTERKIIHQPFLFIFVSIVSSCLPNRSVLHCKKPMELDAPLAILSNFCSFKLRVLRIQKAFSILAILKNGITAITRGIAWILAPESSMRGLRAIESLPKVDGNVKIIP
jgi:hypothetical protein